MRAVALSEKNVKRIEVNKEDDSKEGFYLSIIASGICGTDLHLINKGSANLSKILGHEFYGRVEKISPNISINCMNGTVQEGDLVTVVPGLVCGECPYCKGLPTKKNYCINRNVYGMNFSSNSNDELILGGNMEEIFVPKDYAVYKVNPQWPLGLGSLLEPVSVSIKASSRGLELSSTVHNRERWAIVYGVGTIGFFICMDLKNKGVNVVVVDDNEGRRDRVSRNGIEYVFSPSDIKTQAYQELINCKMNGLGFDMAFEVTGDPNIICDCLDCIRKGGLVVEVGNFIDIGTTTVSPSIICNKEALIVGIVLADEDKYADAEKLLEEFVDKSEEVITNFALEDFKNAYDAAYKRDDVLKCNLTM